MLNNNRLLKELDAMLAVVLGGNEAAAHGLVDRIIELFDEGWYFVVPEIYAGKTAVVSLLVFRCTDGMIKSHLSSTVCVISDAYWPDVAAFASGAPAWLVTEMARLRELCAGYFEVVGETVGHTAALDRIEFVP
jgi:hypothetical protein